MRIRVAHAISHRYDQPARAISEVLRLTPADNDGQQVSHWRVAPSLDGRLRAGEDVYGNRLHRFEAEGPIEELTILVEGTVDTFDTAGVLRGAPERLPAEVFLRMTPLTQPDEALIAFADGVGAKAAGVLERLHLILSTLHQELATERPAETLLPEQTAAACYKAGKGLPQDLTHVFIAAARHLDIPARCITGYVAAEAGAAADRTHAWAEGFVEGLGWIGFDVASGLCPGLGHIRLASGLDHAEIAPVRWTRTGGGAEKLAMSLRIEAAQ